MGVRILTGQDTGAGGRTKGRGNGCILQPGSFAGHAVHVGRFQPGHFAGEAHEIKSVVIGEDKDDIGTLAGLGM